MERPWLWSHSSCTWRSREGAETLSRPWGPKEVREGLSTQRGVAVDVSRS